MQAEPSTAEVYIETTPQDIEWAFKLLSDTLFRKSDELSGSLREFYEWLRAWAQAGKIDKFYASDIRRHQRIHPRTLQRYLAELTEYGYISFIGGSKYRSGYQYSIDLTAPQEQLQASIQRQITQILYRVQEAHQSRQESKPVRQGATTAKRSHSKQPQAGTTA